MRTATLVSILTIIFSIAGTRKVIAQSIPLNGVWIPVKQELGGKSLPELSFEKQRLIINDSMYTFIAESTDKGVVKITDNKMDIYGKEGVNTGRHFTTIYKFENDQLVICYNLKGDSYPETFDSKGKPMYFLCTFKRDTSQ